MHQVSCRGFWWDIQSPKWLSALQPRSGALKLLAFPKTKISFVFLFCLIVVQVQLSPFPTPQHSALSNPPPPPTLNPTLLCICPWVLYTYSLMSLSLLSPIHPHFSFLITVSLFFIFMSLVIFCLLVCFVDYIPLTGEIIWYLSSIAWLISLRIKLSISIHAVTKDISSFFFSAV